MRHPPNDAYMISEGIERVPPIDAHALVSAMITIVNRMRTEHLTAMTHFTTPKSPLMCRITNQLS